MALKDDFQNLNDRSKKEYEEYRKELKDLVDDYNDEKRKYDPKIDTINNEIISSINDEMRKLYEFLQEIGDLSNKKRISIYEFEDELHAKQLIFNPCDPPEKQEPKNSFFSKKKNEEKYKEFLRYVDERKLYYENDINLKKSSVSSMKDAIEMAEFFRALVYQVIDTIKFKIIPELDFIRAFLYADAIREKILDGENLNTIKPRSISEYKGTIQDKHYQFVKNSFDFYAICASFIKEKVLTNILEDYIVTEEEKKQFKEQSDELQRQIVTIEQGRVLTSV